MNIAAIALLAATAVVGVVIWYVVDRRRDDIPAVAAVLAAAVPGVLLAAAALFALADSAADDAVLRTGYAIAVLAAIPGGGLLATAVLRLADRAPRTENDSSAGAPPAPPPLPVPPVAGETTFTAPPPATRPRTVSNPDTLRGGATIGVLERVAIVVALLAGWPEGLALTLAVKGFGRYPEMRKPAAPERFIIGTFASILWAAAVAGVAVALRS